MNKIYIPLDLVGLEPGYEIHPTDYYVRDKSGNRAPVEYGDDGVEYVTVTLASGDRGPVALPILVAMKMCEFEPAPVPHDDTGWKHRVERFNKLRIPFSECSLCGKPIPHRVRVLGCLAPIPAALADVFGKVQRRLPVKWTADDDAMQTHYAGCLEQLLPAPPECHPGPSVPKLTADHKTYRRPTVYH